MRMAILYRDLISLKEAKIFIRSDYYRVTGRANDSLLRMWLYARLDLGLRYMFWHRLANCNNILVGGITAC